MSSDSFLPLPFSHPIHKQTARNSDLHTLPEGILTQVKKPCQAYSLLVSLTGGLVIIKIVV